MGLGVVVVVVDVVVGVASGGQSLVPVVQAGASAVVPLAESGVSLDEPVAGEMLHHPSVYGEGPVGVVELDEVSVSGQSVYHELLLGQENRQKVVEFLHFLHAVGVDVEFENIVSVLVSGNVQ